MNHVDEHELRAGLRAVADGGRMTPPRVEALLRAHRRQTVRRRTFALASVSAVGALSAVTVSNGVLVHRQHGKPVALAPGADPTPSARCVADAGRAAQLDPALAAICLPDPAPGFPLRRSHDLTSPTTFDSASAAPLTRTFLLGVTPPVTTNYPDGVVGSTPTGQEASVLVARAGSFPTTPDAIRAARGVMTVLTTTEARGRTATVVRVDDHQIGVLVTVGPFDVAAFGFYGATPDTPVTPDQLVALIESLQHLEG